jgi:hypothetical protein
MTPEPKSRIAPPCCPCNRHTTCEECCAAFEKSDAVLEIKLSECQRGREALRQEIAKLYVEKSAKTDAVLDDLEVAIRKNWQCSLAEICYLIDGFRQQAKERGR